MTYKNNLLAAFYVHSTSTNQTSSKSQPLSLGMHCYSVPSAGYSPVNEPRFTMPSDRNQHTARRETKPQAPCYPLNCTLRSGVFKGSRASKYRTSLLNLNRCAKYESRTSHFIPGGPQLSLPPPQHEDPRVR